MKAQNAMLLKIMQVSVPIRGLFNLTMNKLSDEEQELLTRFRPHQGII